MSAYHEPPEELDARTRDFTRALNTLREEIEAVDWYEQRIVTSANAELKAILIHNRDEEMEHAAMTLEWLRRNMDGWDEKLRAYLFTTAPIPLVEEVAEGKVPDDGDAPAERDLGIRSLKQ